MTHQELCDLAVKWLKRPRSAGGHGCLVALKECRTGWTGEIPDAIGFTASGNPLTDGSVVVEVKVSRGDFLSDAAKPHRISGGVGRWRYFLAPQGLISSNELPDGWGLLEVNGRRHIKPLAGPATMVKHAPWDEYLRLLEQFSQERDLEREMCLLVKAMSTTGDPQKVLDMLREANNRNARLARENDRLRQEARDRSMRRLEQRALLNPMPRAKA